jgi:hypothetical protein
MLGMNKEIGCNCGECKHCMKLHLSSMYGKFGDRPIYLDTDCEIQSLYPHVMNKTFQDDELQEKIALIFGWSLNEVKRTPFLKIMGKLVRLISYYEKLSKSLLKQNERMIEENKLLKSKLKMAENTIDAIETFIREKSTR